MDAEHYHARAPARESHGHLRRTTGMVPAMTLRASLVALASASVLLAACDGQSSTSASTSGALTRVTTAEARTSLSRQPQATETGDNKASSPGEPEVLTD